MSAPSIVWFRLDLRLADQPALDTALGRGDEVVPVFIWAPEEEGDWTPGGATQWWLHQSLASLDSQLRALGSRLILRRGPTISTLNALVRETGAKAIFWNRRYEPAVIARDTRVKEALRQEGIEAESFNAALLHEPWTVQNQSRKPFQVFTPFWKNCLAKPDPPAPGTAPDRMPTPKRWPGSLALADLKLEPRIRWAEGIQRAWRPGEPGAREQLERFLDQAIGGYSEHRNRPDLASTSRLSPHLHFGEISPRQIWHRMRRVAERQPPLARPRATPGAFERTVPHRGNDPRAWRSSQYLAEIGWREFAHHLLYHFPQTPSEPLRADFGSFPWRKNTAFLAAWQRGHTGYPIVDAGMRELWTTGWMHNRVRMIVASFLVKDLLISWTEGARWFWDTLVDADLAQNTLGWQWSAGCGADAAPYFRIFNPVTQGEKFDPQGGYVRRWCPELSRLPDKWIHRPSQAPPAILASAGVVLDKSYPTSIVSHVSARETALEAFAGLKQRRSRTG